MKKFSALLLSVINQSGEPHPLPPTTPSTFSLSTPARRRMQTHPAPLGSKWWVETLHLNLKLLSRTRSARGGDGESRAVIIHLWAQTCRTDEASPAAAAFQMVVVSVVWWLKFNVLPPNTTLKKTKCMEHNWGKRTQISSPVWFCQCRRRKKLTNRSKKKTKKNAAWQPNQSSSTSYIVLISQLFFLHSSSFNRSFCLLNRGSKSLDALRLCSVEDYNNLADPI